MILELILGELFDRTSSLNRSRLSKREDNGNFARVLSDLKERCQGKGANIFFALRAALVR